MSAATGTDDTNTAGTALNNTSGNWRFDEVTLSGTAGVPEPSALAFVGVGLVGAVGAYRCRQRLLSGAN